MHYLYIQPQETAMAEHCRRIRARLSDAELARLPWGVLSEAELERVRRWLRRMKETAGFSEENDENDERSRYNRATGNGAGNTAPAIHKRR